MATKDKDSDSRVKGKPCERCKSNIPLGAKYCPNCGKPEIEECVIDVDVLEVSGGYRLLVQTYRNGIETKCDFIWHVEGMDPREDATKENGTAILPLPPDIIAFPQRKLRVTFHVVGARADAREIFLVPKPPQKVVYKDRKPDDGKSFWENLTRQ